MTFVSRPHTSAALQHLRFSIAAAALALGVALLGQVLVWSFVHFTEMRIVELRPVEEQSAPQVVPSRVQAGRSLAHSGVAPDVANRVPVAVNTVPGAGDVLLRRTSGVVQTMGVLSAALLVLLMLQGVSIAGGANVPGVEFAVTGATWTLIVAMLAMPLRAVLPSVVYPGVFVGYEELVFASERYRLGAAGAPGALGFYGLHALLPVLMLGGLAAAVLRFRAGIERGVIVTNVSQLDEKLEREIRSMKLGQLSTPRAMGALHQAIGADHVPEGGYEEEDEPLERPGTGERGMRPSPGSPVRRPI